MSMNLFSHLFSFVSEKLAEEGKKVVNFTSERIGWSLKVKQHLVRAFQNVTPEVETLFKDLTKLEMQFNKSEQFKWYNRVGYKPT